MIIRRKSPREKYTYSPRPELIKKGERKRGQTGKGGETNIAKITEIFVSQYTYTCMHACVCKYIYRMSDNLLCNRNVKRELVKLNKEFYHFANSHTLSIEILIFYENGTKNLSFHK